MVLLETLSPLERAAYILHEAFDYSHAEVAAILDRSEEAVRQLVHRARDHVRARRPRFAPSREAHAALLGRFLTACASGSVADLQGLLAADAVLVSDGGGKAQAARKPVVGATAVAKFFAVHARKAPPDATYEIAVVNGWPALVSSVNGRPWYVLSIETDGEKIYGVQSILNPDKLARLNDRTSA